MYLLFTSRSTEWFGDFHPGVTTMTDKIKVLFLAANPMDSDRLQLDKEAREIEKKLEDAKHGESIRFYFEMGREAG